MLRLLIAGVFLLTGTRQNHDHIGSIERFSPQINKLIKPDAKLEIIAEGYEWSEGPVWVEKEKMLLFSDIPRNSIYKWTEKGGAELYLKPAGYTGSEERGGETGSNGLALTKDGKLVLCQHGDRRIAMMDAPLNAPQPRFISLADNYKGKKFNSPNDLVIRRNGDIFFTDPPYGLEKNMADQTKELSFQGVYKLSKNGDLKLLLDSIPRPNGIALTPDEKTLIVANSDGKTTRWHAYNFGRNDSLINHRIYGAPYTEKGGADGLKIDSKGNVFATGPGGVWIFDKNGKTLGRLKIPAATSNCALSKDEKTLYITADMYVLRLKMR
ncbi:MAG TPA: SMP-30/gluconolactonase/LRE family protein [Chitinophagaceae bacterium]|jgi:gluconolactonase|nr:SMP-30/gluconolactonase/LRE family protein [Chitinophagaceae bacterium]